VGCFERGFIETGQDRIVTSGDMRIRGAVLPDIGSGGKQSLSMRIRKHLVAGFGSGSRPNGQSGVCGTCIGFGGRPCISDAREGRCPGNGRLHRSIQQIYGRYSGPYERWGNAARSNGVVIARSVHAGGTLHFVDGAAGQESEFVLRRK
jgi:hypothetical protein